jgi:hypothetical protein
MQIYELTTKSQVNEGLWDNIKLAVQSHSLDKKIKPMADKAYYNWKLYIRQLEKSITDPIQKKNFINRTDGRYERELISYVQKNLLGGQYLPNLNNHDDILNTIKQLSAPVGAPSASQVGSGYVASYNPTVAKPAAKPSVPNTSSTFGKLDPNNPDEANLISALQKQQVKTPVSEAAALDEKTERALWQNLVRMAATASTMIQTKGAQAPRADTVPATTNQQNPQQSAAFIAQSLSNLGVKPEGLKAVGSFAIKSLAQGQTIAHSTGNPAADGLLVSMGFRIV